MAEVSRPYMLCESCNHIWMARTPRTPSKCPRCRTTYITVVTPENFRVGYECLACNHVWEVWVKTSEEYVNLYDDNPLRCPHCYTEEPWVFEDDDTDSLLDLLMERQKYELTFQPPGTFLLSDRLIFSRPSSASAELTPKEPKPLSAATNPYKEPKASTTFGTLGFGGFVAVVAVIVLIGYCMANTDSGCDPWADDYADCRGSYEMSR